MSAAGGFAIRAARPDDVPEILALVRGLARFERLEHLVECTEASLHEALFGARPAVETLVASGAGHAGLAGMALFFHNYSTFLGKPGLYLEDVYVRPEFRGRGCGKALLIALARIAVARGCGRFEWAVLDWNTEAQEFYRSLGATVLPDWRIVRVTGQALRDLGGSADPQ